NVGEILPSFGSWVLSLQEQEISDFLESFCGTNDFAESLLDRDPLLIGELVQRGALGDVVLVSKRPTSDPTSNKRIVDGIFVQIGCYILTDRVRSLFRSFAFWTMLDNKMSLPFQQSALQVRAGGLQRQVTIVRGCEKFAKTANKRCPIDDRGGGVPYILSMDQPSICYLSNEY